MDCGVPEKGLSMTKTWFITGTSTGFGRLLTEKLLDRGERVAATLRNVAALDTLRAENRDLLWAAALDVTDTTAVRQVIDRAFGELGRIDVVVNNAGYGLFGAAEEVSDDQIRQQIDTNVIGSIQIVRAALPHLRAQGGGRIIQLSSEGGQITYPSFSLYHASKWAIEGFIEATAKEVAPFGIGFTLIEPGPTGTNFRASLVRAEPLAVYERSPAGEMRRALDDGTFRATGDASKVADAIIASVDVTPAPLRLALGSSAYTSIRAALVARLAALDAQEDIARSTDNGG